MRRADTVRRLAFVLAVMTLAGLAAGAAGAGTARARAGGQNDRCFACHARPGLGTVGVRGVEKSLTVDRAVWDESRHNLLDCTSCHIGFKPGEHGVEQTTDWYVTATVNACRNCHDGVYGDFAESAHGAHVGVAANGPAPTCGTCHAAHAVGDVRAPPFERSSTALCESCHGGRAHTYQDTYHGKAYGFGREDAATCQDCHGAHLVLPASNPASSVSSQNIVTTCRRCHAGANTSFASYMVHIDPRSPKSSAIVFMFYAVYVIMIAVVFTFGGVHSVLYFYRGRKEGRYRRQHG